MTQRIEQGAPTGMHRRLETINDGAYPSTLYSVGKLVFVEFPTIFVILQLQKQLIDHVVQVHLLSSQLA